MTNAIYYLTVSHTQSNMKITTVVLGEMQNKNLVEFAENNFILFFLYEFFKYVYQHQVSQAKTCIKHFTKTFYKSITNVFYWNFNTLNTIKQ